MGSGGRPAVNHCTYAAMTSNKTGKTSGKSVERRILGDAATRATPCNFGIESNESSLPTLVDEFFERQRAVVFFIMGGIDESDPTLPSLAPQDVDSIPLVSQFLPVADRKSVV